MRRSRLANQMIFFCEHFSDINDGGHIEQSLLEALATNYVSYDDTSEPSMHEQPER